MKRAALVVLALGCVACGVQAAEVCGAALKSTRLWLAEADGTRVAFISRPDPAPVGQHFQIHFVVCSAGVVRSDAKVQVDADMPAHRHGMNYRTTVSSLGAGVQRAQGLMFHMPGVWRVIFDVTLPDRQAAQPPLAQRGASGSTPSATREGRTLRLTREIEVQ